MERTNCIRADNNIRVVKQVGIKSPVVNAISKDRTIWSDTNRTVPVFDNLLKLHCWIYFFKQQPVINRRKYESARWSHEYGGYGDDGEYSQATVNHLAAPPENGPGAHKPTDDERQHELIKAETGPKK